MHAVIRRYTGAARLMEELDRKPQEVEQLMSTVPGFVEYHGIREGDTLVAVFVCRDRNGIEESTRRAEEWVRENLPAGAVEAPEVMSGEVFLSFGSPHEIGVWTAPP